MIGFKIRSGTYSDPQFKGMLRRYIPIEEDLNEFIEAAIKTDQIKIELGQYILPETEPEILTYIKYEDFYPEKSEVISGGGKGIKRRIAIRKDMAWRERYGDPTDMYLSKVWKDGVWINIKEKPQLSLIKTRRSAKEGWRTQIPTSIKREYGLTMNDIYRVGIRELTIDYFHTITLWGYQFDETLTFDYTRKPVNERHLELRGIKFVSEIKKISITEEIHKIRLKIQKLMNILLKETDAEYYAAIYEGRIPFEITDGRTLKPSKEQFFLMPEVSFIDLDRGDLVLLEWRGRQSFDKIPTNSIDFELVDTKIQARRVTGTKWWPNQGGFR